MKTTIYRSVYSLFFLLFSFSGWAQCAMCKVNAENASRENVSVGEELNNGIIYLMGIPYVLLATIVLVFYRKKIVAFMRS